METVIPIKYKNMVLIFRCCQVSAAGVVNSGTRVSLKAMNDTWFDQILTGEVFSRDTTRLHSSQLNFSNSLQLKGVSVTAVEIRLVTTVKTKCRGSFGGSKSFRVLQYNCHTKLNPRNSKFKIISFIVGGFKG